MIDLFKVVVFRSQPIQRYEMLIGHFPVQLFGDANGTDGFRVGGTLEVPGGTFYSFADFSHYGKDSVKLSEFLLEKGAIDMIVDRRNLRDEISALLDLLTSGQRPRAVRGEVVSS